MIDLFDVLAAPARRALLDELCDENGQTLFSLVARLTMKHGLSLTRQAVSQHLAVLEDAGLVRTRWVGRCKHHDFDPAPLHTLADRWIGTTHNGGPPCTSPSRRSSSTTRPRRSTSTRQRSASR